MKATSYIRIPMPDVVRIDIEERIKQLDDQLQEKKLILLRGVSDADLACKIRYDMREIEKESNELLHKLSNDQY